MATARIFEEADGKYYICDDDAEILDARGKGHPTKAEAMRAAADMGYTHAVGSGTYWEGVRKLPQDVVA
jgi:hypothetical protein